MGATHALAGETTVVRGFFTRDMETAVVIEPWIVVRHFARTKSSV